MCGRVMSVSPRSVASRYLPVAGLCYPTYVASSLTVPGLWLAALWLAGGYGARFIGTGSDEFCKVLNAG